MRIRLARILVSLTRRTARYTVIPPAIVPCTVSWAPDAARMAAASAGHATCYGSPLLEVRVSAIPQPQNGESAWDARAMYLRYAPYGQDLWLPLSLPLSDFDEELTDILDAQPAFPGAVLSILTA